MDPKHLIFFDSDIDIEYQYSESTYKSNYFETDINGSLNNSIKYNQVVKISRYNTM